MKTLQNKVAVIFAATGAVAGAVAHEFANQGAQVYVSGRNLAAAQQVAAAIEQNGGWAKAHQADAMDENAIHSVFKEVVETHGKLDIVFNGIGLSPEAAKYGTLSTELSFDDFMNPLRVHAGSQFLTARIAAQYMIQKQHPGTILMLTASLSRIKVPFMTGITAACTAIEGLTRALAAEFGQFGIKVLCMNPTAIQETRTIQETTKANAKLMGMSPEAFQQMSASQYLLRKSPNLKEVAAVAAFLASDAGAALNSHIIDVDFGSMSVI